MRPATFTAADARPVSVRWPSTVGETEIAGQEPAIDEAALFARLRVYPAATESLRTKIRPLPAAASSSGRTRTVTPGIAVPTCPSGTGDVARVVGNPTRFACSVKRVNLDSEAVVKRLGRLGIQSCAGRNQQLQARRPIVGGGVRRQEVEHVRYAGENARLKSAERRAAIGSARTNLSTPSPSLAAAAA